MITKKIILSIFVFLLLIHLYSCKDMCTKKVDCPSFSNAQFFKWFPYTQGQTVVFKSPSGGLDTIVADSVTKSESYTNTYSTGFSSKPAVCSTMTQIAGREIYISYLSNDTLNKEIIVRLKSQGFPASNISDTGLTGLSYSRSKSYFGYTFSGILYDTLQKIYTTDTAFAMQGGIDTIFIAKGHGIIGYTTYPALETWSIR